MKFPVSNLITTDPTNDNVRLLQILLIEKHLVSIGHSEETAKKISLRSFFIVSDLSSTDSNKINMITFKFQVSCNFESLEINLKIPENNPHWMYVILDEHTYLNL